MAAPPVPLLLAEVERTSGALSLVTALAAVLLAGFLWFVTRRRWPRFSWAFLLVGALLVASAYLPPAKPSGHAEVTGFLTGEARIPVVADADAPVRVDAGGEGRLEKGNSGTHLVLRCPARCNFSLGDAPSPGARHPARVSATGSSLSAILEGGPLLVRATSWHCERLPIALRVMGGGDPCGVCAQSEYLAPAGSRGAVLMTPPPTPVC